MLRCCDGYDTRAERARFWSGVIYRTHLHVYLMGHGSIRPHVGRRFDRRKASPGES